LIKMWLRIIVLPDVLAEAQAVFLEQLREPSD
jgi:hypothetical protein